MKCPNCGQEIQLDELFCPICGMRVQLKSNTSVELTNIHLSSIKQSFRNFTEWAKYWAELFAENHAYWSYQVEERLSNASEEVEVMFACIIHFSSSEDMYRAHAFLYENGEDIGYGMPADYILPVEDENYWLVCNDCSSLPYVLLVADHFGGEIAYWSDYFIPCPPQPISMDKSADLRQFRNWSAPKKAKRHVPQLKNLARKCIQTNGFVSSSSVARKTNLRSMYIFYDERDYENAKAAIYNVDTTTYHKLNWYGDWGPVDNHQHAWRVDLYDDLTQTELEWVVGRIREQGGLYYPYQ